MRLGRYGLQKLEEHVRSYIQQSRKKVHDIDPNTRGFFMGPSSWVEPSQVFVFWFQEKGRQIDFQTFLITHWPDVEDFFVKVFGPIAPENVVSEITRILQDPLWSKRIKGDKRFTFKELPFTDILESALIQANDQFYRIWTSPYARGPIQNIS